MRFWLLLMLGCLLPSLAMALPVVNVTDTGKQFFINSHPDCKANNDPEFNFDDCGCSVQIKYVKIEGNEAVNKIMAAEADLKSYCDFTYDTGADVASNAKWMQAKEDSFAKPITDITSEQTVTYKSEKWLNVQVQDYVYSGGAHGNTGLSNMLFDLESGKRVEIESLLDTGRIADVNYAIQAELDKRKGDIFEENYRVKNPSYIKMDGTCELCTYVLKNDGLHAVFGQYAVAPYAVGFIDILLPAYILKQPFNTKEKAN